MKPHVYRTAVRVSLAMLLASVAWSSYAELPGSGPVVPELAPLEQAMTNFMTSFQYSAGTLALMKDSKLVLRTGYGWRDTNKTVVIHPDNPVRTARLRDIGKILTGEISNWKQLGGPDLPIRVVAVREGGGVLATVEARLLGPAHIAAPDAIRVQVGTQIVRVVAQEPGAIGITQLAIVKSSSAVEITTDEPIEQVLSLVSLDDPSPAASATIEAFRRIARQGT